MTARRSSSRPGAPLTGLAATHVAGRRTRSPGPSSCGPSGRSRPPCRPSLPPGRRPAGPACQTRPATPRGLRSWATGGWGWPGGSSRSRFAVLRTPHQHWASTHHRPLRPRVGLLGWAGTPCGGPVRWPGPRGRPVPHAPPSVHRVRHHRRFRRNTLGITVESIRTPARTASQPPQPSVVGHGWLGVARRALPHTVSRAPDSPPALSLHPSSTFAAGGGALGPDRDPVPGVPSGGSRSPSA